MKNLIGKLTIATGIVLSAAVISDSAKAASSPPATPNSFQVTVEAPGVQQSTLFTNPNAYGATGVFVNNFDSASIGYSSNSYSFGGKPAISTSPISTSQIGISQISTSQIGSYSNVDIVQADQYGGAGGTGNYFTVQPGKDGTSSDPQKSKSTLTLNTPERYFGLWWSAGDAYNEMDFYSGNTLLQKFTTTDVIDFINQQSNAKDYYSNPNSKFQGQNQNEPYAFLNFFADPKNTNVTFNKIEFINNSTGTGFESDNHTVASSYKTTSGKIVSRVPEPNAALGLAMIAGIGMLSQRRKISQKA